MLNTIKEKLSINSSPESLINQLTKPSFFHNLNPQHLQQLTKIVQGKQGGYKLDPKVTATIYSIIVMKNYKDYNTKLAIQFLTKYYRNLSPASHHDGVKQPNAPPPAVQQGTTKTFTNKTTKVVANLLIRIPTFSNYKLIIKDISPELLPASILLEHRAHIYKQCPNLYKDHLIKQHKATWYQIMDDDWQNYPLHEEFAILTKQMQQLINIQNVVLLYEKHAQIQKNLQYIRNRIISLCMKRQQINIQSVCESIQQIFSYCTQSSKHSILPQQIKSRQVQYIRSVKNSCMELLRLLIIKLGNSIYRKLGWLRTIIDGIVNRYYDEYSIDPRYLISFCTSMLRVYGLGVYDFDALVHRSDSISSISMLISALCYNNYQINQKQPYLVNYQSQKASKSNSKQIHINLYNTTLIDTAYEPYLKTTSTAQRQLLLRQILTFLKQYYTNKKRYGMELSHTHNQHIFGVLYNTKNNLSDVCKRIVEEIKSEVIFKEYQKIGEGIQQFCNNVFVNYIKKRKQPKLNIQRAHQLCIQPTISTKNNGKYNDFDKQGSFVSISNLSFKQNVSGSDNLGRNAQIAGIKSQLWSKQERLSQNNEGNQLRKTHSFDMQLQGWNTQKKSLRSSDKYKNKQRQNQKSEMFYSIKQCSALDERQKQDIQLKEKQDVQQNHENQFVLTPQF